MALSTGPTETPLTRALREFSEARRYAAEKQALLDKVIAADARMSLHVRQAAEAAELAERKKEELINIARRSRASGTYGDVGVSFSDPETTTFNHSILAAIPGFWDLPGIIKDVKFDAEALEAAAAAGMIPKEVLDRARVKKKQTRDGKVQVKTAAGEEE